MEEKGKPRCGKKTALKLLRRRLPITSWIKEYSRKDFISDIIAGFTVGLTVVPQSMAYASISGLTPEYGLYSSYIGVLVYIVLGSCKQAAIGPTAVLGLLTFQVCGQDYPSCVILTGFYAGVFEILLALLHLGWLVSFISEPVTIGFTAGTALTIISSQLKNFLGVKGKKGSGFIEYCTRLVQDITSLNAADAIMGISSLTALLILRKIPTIKHPNKTVTTSLWLISLSRNAIVIISTAFLAWVWGPSQPFTLVGKVQGGFPHFALPPFLLPTRESDPLSLMNHGNYSNGTYQEFSKNMTFLESWSFLKAGPLIIAFISVLKNVAISKAFGSGQRVDGTQEMGALGVTNIIGGFLSSMPATASFSRSCVNEASGVKTPMAGLFTGALVILSLGLLTESFYFIPKASLAAVIIGAVMFMIEYDALLPMWRVSKPDAATCVITFLASLLLGMDYGIAVGVAISLAILFYKSLKPKIHSEMIEEPSAGLKYILIRPESGSKILNFPSVDHVSSTVQKLSLKMKICPIPIVLDMEKWKGCDYSAVVTMTSLVKGMRKSEKQIVFIGCSKKWEEALKSAELKDPPLTDETGLADYLKKLNQGLKPPPQEVDKGDENGIRLRSLNVDGNV